MIRGNKGVLQGNGNCVALRLIATPAALSRRRQTNSRTTDYRMDESLPFLAHALAGDLR
jgi:hypothetical protein